MAGKLTVKDPNCLYIGITSYDPAAPIGTTDQTIALQGVFSLDGDFATLEPTVEEDEYVETADGQTCVYVKGTNNYILTIRLNSCNSVVNQLLGIKAFGRSGRAKTQRLATDGRLKYLLITVADLCSYESYTSDCAWMITNITRTFGNEDTPTEIKFLLTDVYEDTLVFEGTGASQEARDRVLGTN